MTEADFGPFLEHAIPRRAARMVARGIWTEGHAVEASREFYLRSLPQGVATPDHHLCHIVAEPEGLRVGEVWYTARREGGSVQFWIEWIWIEPDHRRRGYATETLHWLEQEARRRGATRCGLVVWLNNPEAIALYRKVGYSAASMIMVKPLNAG